MFPTRFSLAETLVQNGTGGGMASPASTRISARMKRAQGHGSHVPVHLDLVNCRHHSLLFLRAEQTLEARLAVVAHADSAGFASGKRPAVRTPLGCIELAHAA